MLGCVDDKLMLLQKIQFKQRVVHVGDQKFVIKTFIRKQIKFQSQINSTCLTHGLLFWSTKGPYGSSRLHVRIKRNRKQTFRSSNVDNEQDIVVAIIQVYVAVLRCLSAIAVNRAYDYVIVISCVPAGMHAFDIVFVWHAAVCGTVPSVTAKFLVIVA